MTIIYCKGAFGWARPPPNTTVRTHWDMCEANIEATASLIPSIVSMLVLAWFMHLTSSKLISNSEYFVIKPSTKNKRYALLATLCMLLGYVMRCVYYGYLMYFTLQAHNMHRNEYLFNMWSEVSADTCRIIGHSFYFFYLISKLEYHMNDNEFIRSKVNNKCIIFTKFLAFLNIVLFMTEKYIWSLTDFQHLALDNGKIQFALIYCICSLCIKLSIEISILKSYITGWRNVGHLAYIRDWDEIKRSGETDRIHEILIIITTSTVAVIISFIASTVDILYYAFLESYIYASLLGGPFFGLQLPRDPDYALFIIVNCICMILYSIDDITYAMCIYFMYEFGYDDYRKCCSVCHIKMYNYWQKRLEKQVMDKMFHVDREQRCLCCTKSFYAMKERKDNMSIHEYMLTAEQDEAEDCFSDNEVCIDEDRMIPKHTGDKAVCLQK